MFKNKKYPLKLFAIISLAFVVLTTIFVSIFGVNTSVEIGGGYQLEVTLSYKNASDEYVSGREDATKYVEIISDVLKEHNTSVDSYFVEDKIVDTYLVVRIADNEIENIDKISARIASELQISQSRVSAVQEVSSYFANNQMLYIGLAVLAIIALCFFLGWFRYSITGGVTLAFAALHNLIMSLALIFLYRVQFSIISLAGVLAFTALSLVALVFILERNKENLKSKQYATLSEDENLILATKQNKNMIWFAVALFALTIVMVCIPIRYLQLAGVSLQLCLLTSVYTCVFVAPALNAYLSEIKNTKNKQKLSKNVVQVKK